MSLEIREMDYRRCKGMIASFVARGNAKPETIRKSIGTTVGRGGLGWADVDQMLAEVERDTQAFVRSQFSDPAGRVERLGTIKTALHQ